MLITRQTLWSMPTLSNEPGDTESTTTPKSFILSWIILPLGTYLSSVIFLFIAWVKTSPSGGLFWSRTLTRARARWTQAKDMFKVCHAWMKQTWSLAARNASEDEERAPPASTAPAARPQMPPMLPKIFSHGEVQPDSKGFG